MAVTGVTFAEAAVGCFLSVGGGATLADWVDRPNTPDLGLPGISPVIVAIAAGACAGGSGFEVWFNATDGALLLKTLLTRLLVTLLARSLAAANAVSGALADCAAAALTSPERTGAGAVLGVAEPRIAAG